MKFMTKEIETVLAVVVFFILIRFINFEAHFETIWGDMIFDICSIIFAGLFGIVYSKLEIFEWQDHKTKQ